MNFNVVRQLGGNDQTFIDSFVTKSAEDLYEYLASIKDASASKNSPWILFIKHKAKSLLELLNEEKVSHCISIVAEMAVGENWEMEDQLVRLEVEINNLVHLIKTELKEQEV